MSQTDNAAATYQCMDVRVPSSSPYKCENWVKIVLDFSESAYNLEGIMSVHILYLKWNIEKKSNSWKIFATPKL